MTADGWWPPWTPGEERYAPPPSRLPRERTGLQGFSFHLRDTELLVTAFPGCKTRFFLPITTCHATASRISLFFSFSRSTIPPRPYDRFRLVLSFSSLLSCSLSLSSSCSRAQSSISNDYARRSPQVDPTATHERSRSVQSRGSIHEGVRTALFLFYIDYLPRRCLAKVKRSIYNARAHIASANQLPISDPLSSYQKMNRYLARSVDFSAIAPNRLLENLTYIDLPWILSKEAFIGI